ncbi:MAG: DUF2062 domain-containing protein [Alphaproteobacteria bacterium]
MIDSIKGFIKKLYRYILKTFKDKKNKSPVYIARTFCVGFVAGINPFWGQSLICLIIWTIVDRLLHFRFNLIIACLLTFISNPLTTPIMFYIFYLTGQLILGEASIPFAVFVGEIKTLLLEDFTFSHIWETLTLLVKGIGKPIILGNIPWSVIVGIVGYYIGYRLSIKLRKQRNKKKKHRIRRMIQFFKKQDKKDSI